MTWIDLTFGIFLANILTVAFILLMGAVVGIFNEM